MYRFASVALAVAGLSPGIVSASGVRAQAPAPLLPGYHRSPWFQEQVREEWIEPDVRVLVNAPATFDASRPTELIFYAAPNGNTIEQTLGSKIVPGTDWHFDIQHVAAQTRYLRQFVPDKNIVFACLQAGTRSWPAWRQQHPDNAALIRGVVNRVKVLVPGSPRITLTGHSGGGSFLFGYLNGSEAIPDDVDRIAFLDANYAYNDGDQHGDKLLVWLRKDPTHHLDVLAYDDRNIILDGKKVVGPDGGTFRATERMTAFFRRSLPFSAAKNAAVTTTTGLNGQLRFLVHTNPDNKILHTALVGEMNGLLSALTAGTLAVTTTRKFGEPRAYAAWVQPAAGIPPRPKDAIGGAAFMKSITDLAPAEREEAIATEISRGNIPDFLRTFHPLTLTAETGDGKERAVAIEVMPDYLAVGSDTDFVRVPMTPQTAQRIADAFDCALPTCKIVDTIYQNASVKLESPPLTEAREAVATFVRHNAIIEEQRRGKPLGALVAGIKKDVVLTNRLSEKPNRVAIYGWHKPDGQPIQPLTIVHKDTYVDYSHGIRLIKRAALLDGKPADYRELLRDSEIFAILSDEGPLLHPGY